jgi:hypothetical protein
MMTLPSLRQELHGCGDESPHVESERDGMRILRKKYMKSRSMIRIQAAFCLALAVGAVAKAQADKNLKDDAN